MLLMTITNGMSTGTWVANSSHITVVMIVKPADYIAASQGQVNVEQLCARQVKV